MATAIKQANCVFTADYGNNSFFFSSKSAAVTVLGTGPTRGGKWIESNLSVNGNAGAFALKGGQISFTSLPSGRVRPYQSFRFSYYVDGTPTSQMLMCTTRSSYLTLSLNTSRRLVLTLDGIEYEADDGGIIPVTTEKYIALFATTFIGTDNKFTHVVLMVDGRVCLSQTMAAGTNVFSDGMAFSENLAGGVNRGVTQRFGAFASLWEDGDAPYGEIWVSRLTPNGAGAFSEAGWTGTGVAGPATSYQHVDDASPSTTDADYNSFNAAGPSRLTFALPSLSAGDLPIFVMARGVHRNTSTVKLQVMNFILYDGTNTVTRSPAAPGTTFQELTASTTSANLLFDSAPDGGTWELTDLDNLEIGNNASGFGGVGPPDDIYEVGLLSIDVAYQPSGQADYAALPFPFSKREG